MEDNFAEEVQSKSDTELKAIVLDITGHRGLLIAAAKKEMEARGIALSEEEQQTLEAFKAKRRQDAIRSREVMENPDLFDMLLGTDEEIKEPNSAHGTKRIAEDLNTFIDSFIPRKGYFITPILIDLNIIIFILMAISGVNILLPDTESVLKWGANFRPMTLEGQWWRLLTNCFLHFGILHLLMNMYALLYIGVLLEPVLGRIRFLSAYLLAGISASVVSLWWNDLTISAGASGAIFGMYGVFLPLLTIDLVSKRKSLITSIVIFVVFNLVNGLKAGIDNAAHVGGLISGIIMGYAFMPGLKRPEEAHLKFTPIYLLAFVVLISSFGVYKYLPNDIGDYDKKMQTFVTNEAMALEVFKMPDASPKKDLLYGLKDRGIYYWNENLKIIEDVDSLKLPDVLHIRDANLKEYCELRIKCYELLCKQVEEDTKSYKPQIEEYNQKINTIINDLKGTTENK